MLPRNDCFLRALRCQPTPRTPIWMMRQAGRYLPEYRALRSQAKNFLDFCQTPTMATEATLQPLRRYALDAAILFSDILILPYAMGTSLAFVQEEGPVFAEPIRTMQQVDSLAEFQPDQVNYVLETIERILVGLAGELPLIGFCGSPFTVATYLVEGKSSKQFAHIKQMAYASPSILHALLDKLTKASITYLKAQIQAGVHAVMIFDTWGAIGSQAFYQQFSWAYLKQMVEALKFDPTCSHVPIIVFTKGGGLWMPLQNQLGANALGVDWTMDLHMARQQVSSNIALQGNLDPAILYTESQASIEAAVQATLASYGVGHGHVFNFGHGILPNINPLAVQYLIDAVHRLSPAFHG